jgi:hypothetical protein
MSLTRFLGTASAAALLAAGLTACGTPRTVSHVHSLNDVFDYVVTASLPLEVAGNPFPGVPQPRVAGLAAEGMSGDVNGRPLTFIPQQEPLGPGHDGYRTVLYLGSNGIVSGQALCQGGLPAGEGGGNGRVHASAALCEGGEMVAWGEGWGRAAGPETAAFRSLMDQLANAVFRRAPDRDERGDPWPR